MAHALFICLVARQLDSSSRAHFKLISNISTRCQTHFKLTRIISASSQNAATPTSIHNAKRSCKMNLNMFPNVPIKDCPFEECHRCLMILRHEPNTNRTKHPLHYFYRPRDYQRRAFAHTGGPKHKRLWQERANI